MRRMAVEDLGTYFRGYLGLLVTGQGIEDFLNLALGEGLPLRNLRWLGTDQVTLEAGLADFRRLRHLARAAGCRLRIKRKYGFPFLIHRLRRRRMLLWGALFFLAALYYLGSFVWSVDVLTNQDLAYVSRESILEKARQAGLWPGVHRGEVDPRAVEQRISDDLPQLSWVGIELKGSSAVIRVQEKVLPETPVPAGESADLVAAEDGVVEEVLVMRGRPEVKVGDTVRRGQVLIAGLIEAPWPGRDGPGADPGAGLPAPPPAEQVAVSARGIVRATVWYQFFSEAPLREERLEPTGRSARLVRLRLGQRSWRVWGPEESPFAEHSEEVASYSPPWRNLRLPVEVSVRTYQELVRSLRTYSRQEARQQAEEQALEQARTRLPEGARVMRQRLEEAPAVVEGQAASLRVRLWLEVLQDIAVAAPRYPGP